MKGASWTPSRVDQDPVRVLQQLHFLESTFSGELMGEGWLLHFYTEAGTCSRVLDEYNRLESKEGDPKQDILDWMFVYSGQYCRANWSIRKI